MPPREQLKPQWLGLPGQAGHFAEVLQGTAKFLVAQRSIRSAPPVEAYRRAINTAPLAQALA